jgi:RNA polymerase sigma-70 factor (ECF subfamily)
MDDRELVAGCLQGNPEEFRQIVIKYSPSTLAIAMNILGNRDDAEDACQEAFIQAYRNLDRFDPERSFKNWLYTILYRRCLDHLKRRRRSLALQKKIKREIPRAQLSNPPRSVPPGTVPSRLLEVLSPRERTALCLWANEGYNAREISDVLRCTASTARVYLFQARKKIKKMLEQDNVSLQNC